MECVQDVLKTHRLLTRHAWNSGRTKMIEYHRMMGVDPTNADMR